MQKAYDFFLGDIVGNEGFILSADTLNPAHIGPKLRSFAALDTKWFPEWCENFPNYVWGENPETDQQALDWLMNIVYGLTAWAHDYVPGMSTDEYLYEFGFSEYDGALLGWWKLPLESDQ